MLKFSILSLSFCTKLKQSEQFESLGFAMNSEIQSLADEMKKIQVQLQQLPGQRVENPRFEERDSNEYEGME